MHTCAVCVLHTLNTHTDVLGFPFSFVSKNVGRSRELSLWITVVSAWFFSITNNQGCIAVLLLQVYFQDSKSKDILSVMKLTVEPQQQRVDQVFHFYHPEGTFMKKALQVPLRKGKQRLSSLLGSESNHGCRKSMKYPLCWLQFLMKPLHWKAVREYLPVAVTRTLHVRSENR